MTNLNNADTFAAIRRDIKAVAKDEAKGRDAMPRAAKRLVKGARDGGLFPKEQDGVDHAKVLAQDYMESDGSIGALDYKKGTVDKLISQFRSFIKMGCITTIDAVDVIARAESIHQTMDSKDRKPAYIAFTAVCAAQLRNPDSALTDAELVELVGKADGKERTQADFLKSAAKAFEKALQAPDANPELAARIQGLIDDTGSILHFIEAQAKRAELLAQLAELNKVA